MKTNIETKSRVGYQLESVLVSVGKLFVLFALSLVMSGLMSVQSFAYDKVRFEATESFKSQTVLLRANISKPEGEGPFPAVVLMHGCGGWQAPVRMALASYTDEFVKRGYVVLNLDSFGPRRLTGGKVCASYKKLREARDYRTQDAFDALAYLKTQAFVDSDNVFLMGQSNGGSVAINVANSNRIESGFRAVVAYYPWCGAFGDDKVELSSPLLVLGGAKDDWVPPQACKSVVSTGAELTVNIYSGAAHSFDLNIMEQRFQGNLIGYNQEAAKDGRIKMTEFFSEHIVKATQLAQN